MSITSASRLKSIAVIVGVLAVCAPLAAQDPGGKTYEVMVSLVPPEGDPFPVACTCLSFDALDGQQTACLRSFNASGRQQLLALWSFSNLDLVPEVTEVQATTGASLPSVCGGPRAGFEGFAFHGTVNGPTIFDLELEVIAEVAPRLRLLQGWEVEDCSQACQQP